MRFKKIEESCLAWSKVWIACLQNFNRAARTHIPVCTCWSVPQLQSQKLSLEIGFPLAKFKKSAFSCPLLLWKWLTSTLSVLCHKAESVVRSPNEATQICWSLRLAHKGRLSLTRFAAVAAWHKKDCLVAWLAAVCYPPTTQGYLDIKSRHSNIK